MVEVKAITILESIDVGSIKLHKGFGDTWEFEAGVWING
jgi:hypothetical protein